MSTFWIIVGTVLWLIVFSWLVIPCILIRIVLIGAKVAWEISGDSTKDLLKHKELESHAKQH